MKISAIIATLLLIAVFFAWTRSPSKTTTAAAPPETVAVRRGNIATKVQSTATITPENKLEIKAPIAGRAESVLVDIGTKVKRGDVLAMMSSAERAALLDAARAKGEKEVKFWEDVYRPAPLVAPLDGVIISRSLVPGQVVQTSDVVFIMSDHLIARADMDETDLARIYNDQPAEVSLDSYPDNILNGRVFKIAYNGTVTNNVTTYPVDVAMEQTPEFVKSGMTANVSFILTGRTNVLLLPADAVAPDDTVELPPTHPGDKAGHHQIKTGMSDGQWVEVAAGLEEGQLVLRESYALPPEKTTTGFSLLPRMSSRTNTPPTRP